MKKISRGSGDKNMPAQKYMDEVWGDRNDTRWSWRKIRPSGHLGRGSCFISTGKRCGLYHPWVMDEQVPASGRALLPCSGFYSCSPWPAAQSALQKIGKLEKKERKKKYWLLLLLHRDVHHNRENMESAQQKQSITILILHNKWQIYDLENCKTAKMLTLKMI